MDVNGTKFHLVRGKNDWQRFGETPEVAGRADAWLKWQHTHWDATRDVLTLMPQLLLFRHRKRPAPLSLAARRGADSDANGNWFWISHDERTIYWLPTGTDKPAVYWDIDSETPCPPDATFGPITPVKPVSPLLSGLAVTTQQYLVVGNRADSSLLLFDLRAGGAPTRLRVPDAVPFTPFDMASAPNGGVWILDRVHRTYWGLDAQFRFLGSAPPLSSPTSADETAAFQPEDSSGLPLPPAPCPMDGDFDANKRAFPRGFALDTIDPVSIEALPDGSVLILDSPGLATGLPVSTLWQYRLAQKLAGPIPIHADLEIAEEGQETVTQGLDVIAYDMAYIAANQTLYVVERDGTQVIAFDLVLNSSPPRLGARADYLPLHYFGGRALVTRDTDAFYDVVGGDPTKDANVHWLPVQSIDQPRYDRDATLYTPLFDGRQRDCVWHRLFLDACIPLETGVQVWTRAHNDPELLLTVPFRAEPNLYQRGRGAEIPFYDPFPGQTPAPGKGTWELLFQKAQGRYLQIQLELSGNGHTSPELENLRAWYPRFSYPRHYLPSVYLQDADSADFLERMLANTEGFYTDIEDKIRDIGLLLDPRSAPPEALDWLASWVGLVVDPIWADLQKRRQQASGGQTMTTNPNRPAPDRRRLFIRFAYRLYEQRGTTNGMLLALHLLLDPCLEETFALLKQAAVAPLAAPMVSPGLTDPQQTRQIASLRALLTRLNLPLPNPAMRDSDLEDLLVGLLLSPSRPSQVRLVERYRTRGGRGLAAGDPNAPITDDSFAATAHRFSVLIPVGLLPEEEAMVNRLVNLEKPAHTQFDMGRYWDLFLAGQARLGIDTILGASSRFAPIRLGQTPLAGGYLPPPPPLDATDRIVVNRDRVGIMPPL